MAITLNYLGDESRCEADYRLAESFYVHSRALFEKSGVRAESASGPHNLCYVAFGLGDCRRAKALFTESLALHRKRVTGRADEPGAGGGDTDCAGQL